MANENQIVETLTNPPAAVTASTVGVVAVNFISSLPVVINILWITYVFLLVAHKAYRFYKELKADRSKKEISFEPSE